ncbi:helix-turn-helix domain-containing protein [Bifidobacterium sp. 64T4]|uniref:PucR family transcriptional regulator n=1 Tax=Bifidobacterium pongonis TaxID=2834432 RepID=UPI001C5911FC|nr:helix-turn-helix domain-containing protein [Bifidobacterium pongonis]MBW3095536.1 helix-turn-helix domain-containing protein [Bifidobacterium pongonis]
MTDFLDLLLADGAGRADAMQGEHDRSDVAETLGASGAAGAGDADAVGIIRAVAFECLLNGVTDERAASLLRILGFDGDFTCCAVAGRPAGNERGAMETVRRAIADIGGEEPLTGMRGETLVVLFRLQPAANPDPVCTAIAEAFDGGTPLCLGPVRRGITGAAGSIQAALTTLRALPALQAYVETSPAARLSPPLLRAEEALPERALLGDEDARRELVDGVYASLSGQGEDDPTMLTVSSFLESGGSLEVTARMLNVHPNTVRYRLKRMADTTGWDATDPRDATVLTTAITLGRIASAERH